VGQSLRLLDVLGSLQIPFGRWLWRNDV
jgi:hypothetical protein